MALLDELKKLFAMKGETLAKSEIVTLVGDLSSKPKPLKPSDPAPTTDGIYIPIVDGPYANAGDLIRDTSAGGIDYRMEVKFIKEGSVWVKNSIPIDSNAIQKNDISIKADELQNLFPYGIIVNDRLVNSTGGIQVSSGWKVIVINRDSAEEDFIYASGLMSNRPTGVLYWRFENAAQEMLTTGQYTPKVGKQIPIPDNWNRFQITIKEPNDSDSVYANAVISYKGFITSIGGVEVFSSGGQSYNQSLNTTDSVKFAGLETDALKVNGLPTTSAGAAIGGIWIDTANGNVLKVRTV